jgi:hypothetical protein
MQVPILILYSQLTVTYDAESAGLKQHAAIGTPEVLSGLVGVLRAVSRFLSPLYPGSFRPYEMR